MKTTVNKHLFLVIFSFITFSFSFISCDEQSGDTTPPVIDLIAPKEGATLEIGSNVHLDMDLRDNDLLKSYKVEIHDNMGTPHDHNETGMKAMSATEYFRFEKVWDDISGFKNKKVHHHEILIPENVTPGKYHLMVYCLDASNNESYVVRNIILSHEGEEGHDHEGEDHEHEHEGEDHDHED